MIKCTTCVLGGYTPCFLRHEPIILPVRHWAVIHTEPKAASTSNRPGRCVLEVSKPQVCMQHVFPCQSSANHQASGSFIQPFHTQTKPQSINIETQQRESWSIQQQGRSMSVGSSISPKFTCSRVLSSTISQSSSQWGSYPPIIHTDSLQQETEHKVQAFKTIQKQQKVAKAKI